MIKNYARRFFSLFILVVAMTTGISRDVHAQGFVSPFIGSNFGGNSACRSLPDCDDKKLNIGVTVGMMGNVLAFEEEFAYARGFFGTAPGLSSSVLTVMSNVMFAPKIGPVRPYALAGAGLMKPHVELTTSSLLTTDNNHAAWDAGGGLMVFVGKHVGVRGDIRYFHSFQDFTVLGLNLGSTKLDFGRASAALIVRF